MRKNFIFAAICALALISCQNRSYNSESGTMSIEDCWAKIEKAQKNVEVALDAYFATTSPAQKFVLRGKIKELNSVLYGSRLELLDAMESRDPNACISRLKTPIADCDSRLREASRAVALLLQEKNNSQGYTQDSGEKVRGSKEQEDAQTIKRFSEVVKECATARK